MADQNRETPFPYPIDVDYGILHPEGVPLMMVRMIYAIMKSSTTDNLYNRYRKAFKITVDSFIKRNLIVIDSGTIRPVSDGVRQEQVARQKLDRTQLKAGQEDTMTVWLKFKSDATVLQKERARIQGSS